LPGQTGGCPGRFATVPRAFEATAGWIEPFDYPDGGLAGNAGWIVGDFGGDVLVDAHATRSTNTGATGNTTPIGVDLSQPYTYTMLFTPLTGIDLGDVPVFIAQLGIFEDLALGIQIGFGQGTGGVDQLRLSRAAEIVDFDVPTLTRDDEHALVAVWDGTNLTVRIDGGAPNVLTPIAGAPGSDIDVFWSQSDTLIVSFMSVVPS
jgi:hypothetical protein